MHEFDVIVLGAGAAGLFCAGIAGQRGLRVLLLDHAAKVGEKIRISGGGRCNFTNRDCGAGQFLSENPAFCRSALARYTPRRLHRAGAPPRHRLPREAPRPAVLRRLGRTDHRHAAGRMRRRRGAALAALRRASRCGRPAQGFELDTARGSVARRSWWWPPAACRCRRSAPPTSATGWHGSSATAWSSRARPGAADLRGRDLGAAHAAGRRVAGGGHRGRRRQGEAALRRGPAVHPPRAQRAGRAAGLQLLAPGRARCAST